MLCRYSYENMKLKNKEVFEESMLPADDFTRPCRLENCMFFIPTITYAQFTTEIITDKDKTGKNMANFPKFV